MLVPGRPTILIEIGDYSWRNYDFESKSAVYTNTDWPISVIFYGPGADVEAAKDLLWGWTGWLMYGRLWNGSSWKWDSDAGRKSYPGDGDAWHCRIYADPSGNRCTHDTWEYYVVGSTHRDYENFFFYEYFGDTNDANAAVLDKCEQSIDPSYTTENFFFMNNVEDWRMEEEYPGAGEPYHIWDFDGYAEGVYIE